ncbi:DUF1287 domain-containing protein [Luteolibacter flavescens]|uniref:DUF1287 domain-containing protein n=1 Tax=Luteolibacter flavescens TaxID=1859460 RepID=A0ABT3FK11_9BACT|nr:DUF1287 domain-containing protein [Luteolibacter flavescens]MCW1883913.1 DUF1287 domain-containing protein [Luteolibacter flavescens]
MARRRPNNQFGTIEYIGPRPQAKKPQRKPANFLGGWVVLMIAGFAAWHFGKPLVPLLRAQQSVASIEAADVLIGELAPSLEFGERLASAALQRTKMPSAYDTDYYAISYPGGDLPLTSEGQWRGKAEDLIVRSYRNLGIDLQELVHEDMAKNFSVYPQLWKRREPDRNIDHRLVQNLQRYFKHQGAELKSTRETGDYKPGDVVVWMLSSGELHCGVVVPGPGERRSEAWVVHDIGSGPKWENALTNYQLYGHYRFTGVKHETAGN